MLMRQFWDLHLRMGAGCLEYQSGDQKFGTFCPIPQPWRKGKGLEIEFNNPSGQCFNQGEWIHKLCILYRQRLLFNTQKEGNYQTMKGPGEKAYYQVKEDNLKRLHTV